MFYFDATSLISSAYADGAHRTFENYGYTDVDKHLGFGSKKQKIADKILRGGRPVYLDGYGNDFRVFQLSSAGTADVG